MNNKLKLGFCILLLIFFMASVYADQVCYVGEVCPLETIVYNTSEILYNGTVTTTILNQTDIILLNQEMTRIEGLNYIYYSYNYTFNQSGSYVRFSVAESKLGQEHIIVQDISQETILATSVMNGSAILFLIMVFIISIIGYFVLKK